MYLRPETASWVRQAEADLRTGEIVLAVGIWYAASWFAQQSAEKAVKALYLERRDGEAPRTHDLLLLGRRLDLPVEIAAVLETLVPAFDLSRYPDDMGIPPVDAVSDDIAGRHMAAA